MKKDYILGLAIYRQSIMNSTLLDFLANTFVAHIHLPTRVALFSLFLIIIGLLFVSSRNFLVLLGSAGLLMFITSPLYIGLFVGVTSLLYLIFRRLEESPHRKGLSYLLAAFFVFIHFAAMNFELLHSPWTGPTIHKFGIAYSLIRLLMVVVDVGNGKKIPLKFFDYLTYLFFYPTFFQGPIERIEEFKPNLALSSPLPTKPWAQIFLRILGAFLKSWVALYFFTLDWKNYFDYPQQYSYLYLLWGMYARAISFYLFASMANDFAISFSSLGGFHLEENYNYPYFKRNLAEFWRSWHMTFTRFLRDYVYIPLGGSKRHVYFNYLVVFMAIALWHVPSLAFVIWGLWHGLGMCFLRLWKNFWRKIETKDSGYLRSLQLWMRARPRFTYSLSTLFTFHFVALSWLPFWGGHPQGLSMILRILTGNQWSLFLWEIKN